MCIKCEQEGPTFRKMSYYCKNCDSKIIFETTHKLIHPGFDCFCGEKMEHILCEKQKGFIDGLSPYESRQ